MTGGCRQRRRREKTREAENGWGGQDKTSKSATEGREASDRGDSTRGAVGRDARWCWGGLRKGRSGSEGTGLTAPVVVCPGFIIGRQK
eukprot:749110-Hanusia_phi.AAC.2